MASTLSEDSAHLPPWTVQWLGPLLRTPEQSPSSWGGLPRLRQPASGRPKVEESPPFNQQACGSVNIFLGARPQRQNRMREEGAARLGPPKTFDHFDFTGPLLQQGEHFLFVPVGGGAGGGGGVCKQLKQAMAQLEAVPQRARCIARGGQQLSRAMDMEHVYDYMASTLREASLRQEDGVAARVIRAESSHLVTKQNFFSFVPPAKRPWMEHIFVPAHQDRFNNTPFLPPRGAETSSGLFH